MILSIRKKAYGEENSPYSIGWTPPIVINCCLIFVMVMIMVFNGPWILYYTPVLVLVWWILNFSTDMSYTPEERKFYRKLKERFDIEAKDLLTDIESIKKNIHCMPKGVQKEYKALLKSFIHSILDGSLRRDEMIDFCNSISSFNELIKNRKSLINNCGLKTQNLNSLIKMENEVNKRLWLNTKNLEKEMEGI